LLGGSAVNVSIHHFLADAKGCLNFINHWSDVFNGLEIETESEPIVHSRNPFSSPIQTSGASHSNSESGNKNEFQTKADFKEFVYSETEFKLPDLSLLPPLSVKLLYFTPEALLRLKQAANASSATNADPCSTNDALCALIWRSTARVRGLEGDDPTCLSVAVNARKRITPPLSRNYFGNVLFNPTTAATKSQLEAESFSETAAKIHAAVQEVGDDYVRSTGKYFEGCRYKSGIFNPWFRCFLQKGGFCVSSLQNFPFYSVRLSEKGKALAPVYAGVTKMPLGSDGSAYAMPAGEAAGGGIAVVMGLVAAQMEKFLEDPEIQKYIS